MLARYSGSFAPAFIVTAALMYWMQVLIGGAGFEVLPPKPLITLPVLKVTPPPVPTRTPPPKLPEPRTPQPTRTTTDISVDPTTVTTGPDGPATPPGLSSPPDRWGGRPGPWISDADLLLIAQVPTPYPYQARVRELEGFVIVEFTVTRRGTVSNARVVESTHSEFEAAAVATVAKSRYRPRVVNGVPVDVPGLRTEVAFRLED